jgi:Fe-S-cluster-containing hydrogenase component 2
VRALSLTNGRAHIDEELCKGCGRCLMVCPTGAIALRMDEQVDTMEQLMRRITRRTDIRSVEETLSIECR